jgi:ATP-dependent Clp protease, protease subunit
MASDIEIQAREILYLRQRLNQIMSERTGQPIERIEKDTDRDTFLSADDSVAYGLIDKVLDSRSQVGATPTPPATPAAPATPATPITPAAK